MIKINNLTYKYADGTEALKNLGFTIPKEHIFGIMGVSGSGKTTLLNCIARFFIPTEGTILLEDQNILEMDEKYFRSQIGVVFQKLNLFPHMTVLENMTLASCRVQRMMKKEAEEEAKKMLERLGIYDLVNDYPSQVSGGQAQRVAIARGLMLKPKVMLLDEPTSALDAKTTSEFSQWLRELKADTSFVIVTHDLPFAEQTAGHGIYMSDGKIRESGKINHILKHVNELVG